MYHCSWSVCFRCSSSGLEGEYETDGETIDWTKWRPCCSESSRHLHRRPHWGSSAAHTVHWATVVTPNCSQAAGELHCCKYIQPLCGNMLKMHIQNTLFYWLQFYMHTFFFFFYKHRPFPNVSAHTHTIINPCIITNSHLFSPWNKKKKNLLHFKLTNDLCLIDALHIVKFKPKKEHLSKKINK